MNICILDGKVLNPGDVDWSPISSLGETVIHDTTSSAELRAHAAGAEVLLLNKVPLRKSSLKDIPSVKFIGTLATGYDVVDVAACAERHIPVCNVVAYGVDDVAQHTLALLLELCRRTSEHSRLVREGRWQASGQWCFWEKAPVQLTGLTIGIVGFGAIGRRVGELAHAFGMTVIAHTRTPRNPPPYRNFLFTSLDQLLAKSDVISLHCPLTEATQTLINKETIARMKQGVLLLNTARGSLINEADVAKALKNGRIGGLGTDVLVREPPLTSNPMFTAPNTIITPHMAWASARSRQNVINLMAENIRRWRDGTPVNVVNGVTTPDTPDKAAPPKKLDRAEAAPNGVPGGPAKADGASDKTNKPYGKANGRV